MDDNRFEEIMHKYVSNKSKGKDADFRKMKNSEKEQIPKRKNYYFVFAAVSCVLVVAISLAIILPLTLQSPSDNPSVPIQPPIFYCEQQNISFIIIDSLESIHTEYNIDAIVPNIAYQDILITIMKSKIDDHIIGPYLELSVYDEYFDDIKIHTVAENNVLSGFSSYETFTDEVLWKEITVKYYVDVDDYGGQFDEDCFVKIFFVNNGYKCYIDARYYGDIDVIDMLDMIF